MNDIWLELSTGEIEDRFDGEQVFYTENVEFSRLSCPHERTYIDEVLREELHNLLDESIKIINRNKKHTIN